MRRVWLAPQERTEQVMVHLTRRARVLTGSRRLCVGGVATNCVSIGKIIEAGIFDEVFIPSAPGDAGTAIGAALARSPAAPAAATSAPPTRTSPSA
ncbi:carbamoyltransferase N-terminal domain-containing protein [Streptomyces rochei]|uniref:carbamoyltransferase N-terminal domain-containing protein n=1 Tax=Streptomyces rochei TaxID=1928 RepID=UPI0036AACF51